MTILKRGNRNSEVLKLKKHLEAAGMSMTKSNVFDLVTEAGVRILQEDLNLEKDGIVGPRTWRELQNKPLLFKSLTSVLKWICMTPYYPQRDNKYHPSGTCNVTSLAMVLAYHGIKPIGTNQLEDELFLRLQEPDALAEFERSYPSLKKKGYKPRHIHGMLGWLVKQYGLNWKYSEATTRDQIDNHGKTIGPMIISGSFTSSGHIICLTGMTIRNDMIVHDPWGDWDKGYRQSRNGKFRIYNRENMEKILSGLNATCKRVHRISP